MNESSTHEFDDHEAAISDLANSDRDSAALYEALLRAERAQDSEDSS